MIQANELIINRYFELNGLIVKAIDFEGLNSLYNDIKNLKPIPLTEELLLKFGFNYNDDERVYQKTDVKLEAIDGCYIFNYFFGITCLKYVHQLQNLYFALTTKELTLKL